MLLSNGGYFMNYSKLSFRTILVILTSTFALNFLSGMKEHSAGPKHLSAYDFRYLQWKREQIAKMGDPEFIRNGNLSLTQELFLHKCADPHKPTPKEISEAIKSIDRTITNAKQLQLQVIDPSIISFQKPVKQEKEELRKQAIEKAAQDAEQVRIAQETAAHEKVEQRKAAKEKYDQKKQAKIKQKEASLQSKHIEKKETEEVVTPKKSEAKEKAVKPEEEKKTPKKEQTKKAKDKKPVEAAAAIPDKDSSMGANAELEKEATPILSKIRTELIDGIEIKIIYDEPTKSGLRACYVLSNIFAESGNLPKAAEYYITAEYIREAIEIKYENDVVGSTLNTEILNAREAFERKYLANTKSPNIFALAALILGDIYKCQGAHDVRPHASTLVCMICHDKSCKLSKAVEKFLQLEIPSSLKPQHKLLLSLVFDAIADLTLPHMDVVNKVTSLRCSHIAFNLSPEIKIFKFYLGRALTRNVIGSGKKAKDATYLEGVRILRELAQELKTEQKNPHYACVEAAFYLGKISGDSKTSLELITLAARNGHVEAREQLEEMNQPQVPQEIQGLKEAMKIVQLTDALTQQSSAPDDSEVYPDLGEPPLQPQQASAAEIARFSESQPTFFADRKSFDAVIKIENAEHRDHQILNILESCLTLENYALLAEYILTYLQRYAPHDQLTKTKLIGYTSILILAQETEILSDSQAASYITEIKTKLGL